jgi:NAD(P)-dependent dehydrogenase (short-subunit alcohol dehydrogenase family)
MASPKSIILTGASRGIGLAIAHYLLKASHNVFLVARTAAPMEELKKAYPNQVDFLAADLKDFEVRLILYLCLYSHRMRSYNESRVKNRGSSRIWSRLGQEMRKVSLAGLALLNSLDCVASF